MPLLIILSGLPFSGKSYLAKKIAQETGAVLISYDQIWETKNKELDKWLSWEQVTKLAHTEISKHLSARASVIYDNLGDTTWYRNELRALAEKNDAESVVLYLDTPETLRRERREINKTSQERHTISQGRFARGQKEFEIPNRTENPLTFKPGDSEEKLLEQVQLLLSQNY